MCTFSMSTYSNNKGRYHESSVPAGRKRPLNIEVMVFFGLSLRPDIAFPFNEISHKWTPADLLFSEKKKR